MSFDLVHDTAPETDDTGTEPVQQQPQADIGAEFAALGLAPEIVKAITHAGYTSPTDVQSRTVPMALTGRDLMVSSQTGSGKTAAFVWPALQRILDARNDPAKRREKGKTFGPRLPFIDSDPLRAGPCTLTAGITPRPVSWLAAMPSLQDVLGKVAADLLHCSRVAEPQLGQ